MKKLIALVSRIEELFIGYALLGIAVVATIQVVLRYTMGIAYDWVDEGARYMVILITFVGAGVCVKYGAHFSMDALVQYVPNRGKHFLKIVANLVSMLIMGVTFYYSWVQIGRLHRFDATTPSLQIPMYIPYLPIGIFSLVIAVRFGIQVAQHTRAMIHGDPIKMSKETH